MTRNGVSIPEELIEKWADQAEQGIYPGTPGSTTRRATGRPRLHSQPMTAVTLRQPDTEQHRVKVMAEQTGVTFQQFLRQLVTTGLDQHTESPSASDQKLSVS